MSVNRKSERKRRDEEQFGKHDTNTTRVESISTFFEIDSTDFRFAFIRAQCFRTHNSKQIRERVSDGAKERTAQRKTPTTKATPFYFPVFVKNEIVHRRFARSPVISMHQMCMHSHWFSLYRCTFLFLHRFISVQSFAFSIYERKKKHHVH